MKKFLIAFVLIFICINSTLLTTGYAENNDPPKNVILMIGDGMGIGQLEIARLFEYGKNGRLFIETMPNVALVHTYSANNIVTDSAAGGTALAIGEKTNNESIGLSANGEEKESILDQFKKHGKKVGVVTTSTVTDATPGAFTGSVENRWSGQASIARQQLESGIDVILGGGSKYFTPQHQDGVDLVNRFKEKGYTYITNKRELRETKGEKLLGLFNSSYLEFVVDKEKVKNLEPSLLDMTHKAVDTLSASDNGFFLMVEAGRIDHASHASDITGVWRETIEFDQTVKYAVNWAKQEQDTLVIVVADHETMGISAPETIDIKGLKQVKVSPYFMSQKLKKADETDEYTDEDIKQVFMEYANINLSDEEVKEFKNDIKNTDGKVYESYRVSWEIGRRIAKHYHAGIINGTVQSLSSTGGHTGNMVPIFTYGKSAEKFEGILDNTDIPKMIAEIMGYEM